MRRSGSILTVDAGRFIVAVAADGGPVCDGPRAGYSAVGRGTAGQWNGGPTAGYEKAVVVMRRCCYGVDPGRVLVLLFAEIYCGWITFSYPFGGLFGFRFCWHGVVRFLFPLFSFCFIQRILREKSTVSNVLFAFILGTFSKNPSFPSVSEQPLSVLFRHSCSLCLFDLFH